MNTTVVNFDRTPQAEEEARSWIVRIDAGPLSADERAQLHDWLAKDERHAKLLDSQALLWAAASRAQFPPRAAESMPASSRLKGGGISRPLRWVAATAALVLVTLAEAPHLRSGFEQGVGSEAALAVSTKVGERLPVALPDGSRTELNANSSLRVAYRPDRRRVFLVRGEGLFSVAKDKSRPFEVVAGDTTVRAVGTRFLVQRHDDGRVEVTVYEGVVEVTQRGQSQLQGATSPTSDAAPEPIRLGVGQVAISGPDQTLVALAGDKSMARKLAWQRGRLEFDQTPLSDVLEEVNRYSDQPIRLASETLQGIRVSGSFATQNTSVFLRSLEQGFGIEVKRTDDGWLLSKAP